VVGKSDAKGKEASVIGGFYSKTRGGQGGGGLVASPHVGVDGRRRGGLAAAAASGRVHASPIPRLLTGRDTVGLYQPSHCSSWAEPNIF
jgi:hypothetical protein